MDRDALSAGALWQRVDSCGHQRHRVDGECVTWQPKTDTVQTYPGPFIGERMQNLMFQEHGLSTPCNRTGNQ
jgi:hypothetical protein